MTRIRVLPYRQGSKSAKALATALGGRVLKLQNSKFKPKASDVIINWGFSQLTPDNLMGVEYVGYNSPQWIRFASNKRKFFELMKEKAHEIIPEFWTNKSDIPDSAYPVVCRTVLAGHSGEGIHIANTPDDLVDAPLYVQYVKKKEEYRVHVGRRWDDYGPGTAYAIGVEGEWLETTIAVQRKARRLSVPDEEVNWKVRNLAGGFVFQREGFTAPNPCIEVAHRCLRATGLDFGAVDVVWNATTEKAYVLEVNTAPGLEGQTIEDYAEFFQSMVG